MTEAGTNGKRENRTQQIQTQIQKESRYKKQALKSLEKQQNKITKSTLQALHQRVRLNYFLRFSFTKTSLGSIIKFSSRKHIENSHTHTHS